MTADQAEAGTITWSGPLNAPVGWSNSGFNASFLQPLSGGMGFRFTAKSSNTTELQRRIHLRVISATGLSGLQFAYHSGGWLRLFNAGAAWSAVASAFSGAFGLNARKWVTRYGGASGTYHSVFGPGNFSHEYALFRFPVGAGYDYGWIELSGFVSNGQGPDNSLGPRLTVESWAYDTSGAPIHAGDTGSAVPEPGSFALTGLAALSLGAAGMRRWRAARAS